MIRSRKEPLFRWECRCGDPPILLARYNPGGQIEIKVRDRFYFMASRCVQATCPRCGAQHTLDLRIDEDDDGLFPAFHPDPGTGLG